MGDHLVIFDSFWPLGFDLNDQSIMPDVIMAPLKELHIIKQKINPAEFLKGNQDKHRDLIAASRAQEQVNPYENRVEDSDSSEDARIRQRTLSQSAIGISKETL